MAVAAGDSAVDAEFIAFAVVEVALLSAAFSNVEQVGILAVDLGHEDFVVITPC